MTARSVGARRPGSYISIFLHTGLRSAEILFDVAFARIFNPFSSCFG